MFFGCGPVSIDFMLTFHGVLNCVIFGMFGVLGWTLVPPQSSQAVWDFPVSQVRGELKDTGDQVPGLVDDLNLYVDTKALSKTIVHFSNAFTVK
ncbi:hypothetical protein [Bacillus sp. V5-8f]|uniref:hypothetical protein n=1 Tax=Bacillus sp. V5-8f TaxID=2053044 RepID=UPI000C75BF31|nr:hypothetical protein [Bacillus sp. V5-8f]PLT33537.1 hypothetical protein CUU64_13295 [Bacillus sp. V5-8f]